IKSRPVWLSRYSVRTGVLCQLAAPALARLPASLARARGRRRGCFYLGGGVRAVRSRPSCRDCGVPEKTVLTYFPTKKVADPGPPSYFVAVGSPGLVTVTVFPPPPLLTMAWLASHVPLPSLERRCSCPHPGGAVSRAGSRRAVAGWFRTGWRRAAGRGGASARSEEH